MLYPTKYPELNHVLAQFVDRLKPVLGDNLLAVYLQGSFALGGGDEDSDVDFLVVIEEDVPDSQLSELEAVHLSMFEIESYWSHHLEGSYFPKKLLKVDDPEHTKLVYIDNGSRVLEHSNHDNELVVRWVTREHGITLYGADPETYINPVAADMLKAEVKQIMHTWGGEIMRGEWVANNSWSQPFAVIMYCRMLQTLVTGKIHSKPSAVQWGQSELDAQWKNLIIEAWGKRPNQFRKAPDPVNAKDISQTIDFIQYALNLSATDKL